jgi:DNA-binding NarL/FixJ family response regulator
MQAIIADMPDFDIVGECESGEASLRDVASVRPQLVLMDVRMPGMGGVEAARVIQDRHPDMVVVLISAEEADSCIPHSARSNDAPEFVRKQDLRPRTLADLWDRHRPS